MHCFRLSTMWSMAYSVGSSRLRKTLRGRPRLKKGELNLNPAIECVENLRHVQASGVQHPSKCSIAGKGVTVLSAAALSQDDSCFEAASGLAQGKVLFAQKRLFLGCVDGVSRFWNKA